MSLILPVSIAFWNMFPIYASIILQFYVAFQILKLA